MNAKRAREIIESPNLINVIYNGNPIYIEQVDPENQTATIHSLNDPSFKQNVEVTTLQEQP